MNSQPSQAQPSSVKNIPSIDNLMTGQGSAQIPDPSHISADSIAQYLLDNQTSVLKEEAEDKPLSNVEQFYSDRAGEKLRIYGHNFSFFTPENDKNTNNTPWLNDMMGKKPIGRVQDDFVLGVGDRLRVTFRGQRDDSQIYTITAQGQIIIEGLAPITAAGLSIADLRHVIKGQVDEALMNSTAFVSLDEIRQVNVMVMGEIQKPGQYQLSAFHSVFDALEKAKGLLEHASLRNIKLVRGQNHTMIDLYDLLLGGTTTASLLLKDGDTIHVGAMGHNIAVTGDVKKPAIFELPSNDPPVSIADALGWAGSTTAPYSNRFVLHRLNDKGQDTVIEVFQDGLDTTPVQPGDIIEVAGIKHERTGGVTISGHTREDGFHALALNPDIKTLLHSTSVLDESIYPYFAVIERVQNASLSKSYIAFSPQSVLKGKTNPTLKDRDHIYLFAHDDIDTLLTETRKTAQKDEGHDPLLDKLYGEKRKEYKNEKDRFYAELNDAFQSDKNETPYSDTLKNFVKDYVVHIRGAVQKPGQYPVSGEYTVDELIDLAGGLSPKADKDAIELVFNNDDRAISNTTVSLNKDHDFKLSAGDGLRVQGQQDHIDTAAVRITGEVLRPGYYDLNKGETLYDLMQRAGGLTDYAYPSAAIFMRESEKRRKQKIFQQTAQQLEQSIANFIMTRTEDDEPTNELQFAQRLAQELKTTPVVGRIVVEADPEILRRENNKNTPTLLQPGDHLHIPRRNNTITVTGEVLAPATLAFDMNKDGRDYIRSAGGTTRFADTSRSFVVYPDGSASPLHVASWNHTPDYDIPPGSTIIVPRDPKPYKFFNITSGLTTIFSQLAITSVAVAELTDD